MKERNREWFDRNEGVKERARENLKDILDQYDLIIRHLWAEYERVPKTSIVDLERGIVDEFKPIQTKSRLLDDIRKTIDSKSEVMQLHGITMKEMEMQKQSVEVDEKMKELEKLRAARKRVSSESKEEMK